MPEGRGSDIEIAHRLCDKEKRSRSELYIEILEASKQLYFLVFQYITPLRNLPDWLQIIQKRLIL